jgi:hypothetical protein
MKKFRSEEKTPAGGHPSGASMSALRSSDAATYAGTVRDASCGQICGALPTPIGPTNEREMQRQSKMIAPGIRNRMADIIRPEELARRRAERERKRKDGRPFAGSILDALDDEDDQQRAPASRAREKETHR